MPTRQEHTATVLLFLLFQAYSRYGNIASHIWTLRHPTLDLKPSYIRIIHFTWFRQCIFFFFFFCHLGSWSLCYDPSFFLRGRLLPPFCDGRTDFPGLFVPRRAWIRKCRYVLVDVLAFLFRVASFRLHAFAFFFAVLGYIVRSSTTWHFFSQHTRRDTGPDFHGFLHMFVAFSPVVASPPFMPTTASRVYSPSPSLTLSAKAQ
jgi:hypothetical protein